MRDGLDERERSPGPTRSGPGIDRARRRAESRFYLGLVALVALLLALGLAAIALAPYLIPGWTSVGLSSGSMAPAIHIGDVVLAARPPEAPLEPGTVITFRDASGGLTTHRIDSVNADGSYITKGDANPTVDSLTVEPDQVVGVGRWVVPYIGLPRVWMLQGDWFRLGLFLLTAAASLFLARYAIDPRHDPWRTGDRDSGEKGAGLVPLVYGSPPVRPDASAVHPSQRTDL